MKKKKLTLIHFMSRERDAATERGGAAAVSSSSASMATLYRDPSEEGHTHIVTDTSVAIAYILTSSRA